METALYLSTECIGVICDGKRSENFTTDCTSRLRLLWTLPNRHAIVLNWPSEYYLMLDGNERRLKGNDSFSGALDNILPGL